MYFFALSVVNHIRSSDCYKCVINPLNAELNPLCYLLALLGAHFIFHVSRIKVNGDFQNVLPVCHSTIDKVT